MYCKNCGGKIEPGQKFCANCSAAVTVSSDECPTIVTKYKPQIIKISVLALCMQILSLLLVVTLLFLPIYTSTPELDDIQDLDELGEVLKNDGKLNFSLWDEITLIFDALFPDEGEKAENGGFPSGMAILGLIFFLIELFVFVLLLFEIGSEICKQIKNLCNADVSALLRYDEIKKTETIQKVSSAQRMTALDIIMFVIIDVVISLVGRQIDGFTDVNFYRHMMDISGVSGYVAVVIILSVILFIIRSITKKSEEDMYLSIIKD